MPKGNSGGWTVRHDLKTWPEYFAMVKDGRKRFEVRMNNREFHEGDTLLLQEYEPEEGVFSGNTLTCRVTCVVDGEQFGIKHGYVVMGIAVTGSRIAE